MKGEKCLRRVGHEAVALALLALGLGCSTHAVALPDNWNVEGEHGELHVYGEFTEGACQLDMTSQNQAVDVGRIPAQAMRQPGDRSEPVAFTLRLRGCARTGGNTLDARSGNRLWDALQPAVSVTFTAPGDEDNPQLVRVNGVTGIGLRVTDSLGRDVRLGERSAPQFLTPAQDELRYHVQPERTASPLTAGQWRATLGFKLSYD